jgi:diguanylate cyclase (GGDEF)-like protein
MYDQSLVWNTDRYLQVTSLTARLRDLVGLGDMSAGLEVSDLWQADHLLPIAVAAHQWALDGETLAFETTRNGARYQCEVAPLHDLVGDVIGVTGRALEHATPGRLSAGAIAHAERSAGMGTWSEDLRTGEVTISEGLAALFGTPLHANIDIRAFDHPDDREQIACAIEEAQDDDGYTCDHRILAIGARVRTVRERVRTIFDNRGMAVARIGTLHDISDLKEREAELEELALHDALTRLPNRVALEERLIAAVARCERNTRRCAVLFVDLDDFKTINDRYGHQYGDRVLSSIADRLLHNVRASDTVARLGGDEFVVLIDDILTQEAGLEAGRKLLRSLEEPFVIDGATFHVSASIGIAVYPEGGSTPQELLAMADREMYHVKRNGGSGVKIANNDACPPPSSPARRRYAILESA